jgi:hypothetical protein
MAFDDFMRPAQKGWQQNTLRGIRNADAGLARGADRAVRAVGEPLGRAAYKMGAYNPEGVIPRMNDAISSAGLRAGEAMVEGAEEFSSPTPWDRVRRLNPTILQAIIDGQEEMRDPAFDQMVEDQWMYAPGSPRRRQLDGNDLKQEFKTDAVFNAGFDLTPEDVARRAAMNAGYLREIPELEEPQMFLKEMKPIQKRGGKK